jgi:hypothetical protein
MPQWHNALLQHITNPNINGVSSQKSPQLTVLGICLKLLISYHYHSLTLGVSIKSLGHASYICMLLRSPNGSTSRTSPRCKGSPKTPPRDFTTRPHSNKLIVFYASHQSYHQRMECPLKGRPSSRGYCFCSP